MARVVTAIKSLLMHLFGLDCGRCHTSSGQAQTQLTRSFHLTRGGEGGRFCGVSQAEQ